MLHHKGHYLHGLAVLFFDVIIRLYSSRPYRTTITTTTTTVLYRTTTVLYIQYKIKDTPYWHTTDIHAQT